MTIKLTIELIRFLNAAKRLYSQGFMKKEEILDFARREFGEISGVLKTRLDQIFKKPATGIKKQETKKGEVVPLKKENLNRQLTDDEIEELEIELAVSDPDGPSLSEVYPDFDGTVGSANKIRKERADYIADMEVEYKKGKLDPVAGDKSPARKKFLEKNFYPESSYNTQCALMNKHYWHYKNQELCVTKEAGLVLVWNMLAPHQGLVQQSNHLLI